MVNVHPAEGIRYGIELIVYLISIFIVGFILLTIGGVLAMLSLESGGTISGFLGLLFVFAGFVVILAGGAGMQYKIIADGVEKGVLEAK